MFNKKWIKLQNELLEFKNRDWKIEKDFKKYKESLYRQWTRDYYATQDRIYERENDMRKSYIETIDGMRETIDEQREEITKLLLTVDKLQGIKKRK